MAICDVCNGSGMGTIVPAADFRDAVRGGFDPFKANLAPDLGAAVGVDLAAQWRHDATVGRTSQTDWNVCSRCMPVLAPYLLKRGSQSASSPPASPPPATSRRQSVAPPAPSPLSPPKAGGPGGFKSWYLLPILGVGVVAWLALRGGGGNGSGGVAAQKTAALGSVVEADNSLDKSNEEMVSFYEKQAEIIDQNQHDCTKMLDSLHLLVSAKSADIERLTARMHSMSDDQNRRFENTYRDRMAAAQEKSKPLLAECSSKVTGQLLNELWFAYFALASPHGTGPSRTGQAFDSRDGTLGLAQREAALARPGRGSAHQIRTTLRFGAPQVNGRVGAEVVQRIVRSKFNQFRQCYEDGLRANPQLEGRVSVRFVIDPRGGVSSASNGGSDLPDQDVVACVVRGFEGMSFPQPQGGMVTVIYPIMFSPGS